LLKKYSNFAGTIPKESNATNNKNTANLGIHQGSWGFVQKSSQGRKIMFVMNLPDSLGREVHLRSLHEFNPTN
jgi:hypothetical protein